MTRRLSRHSGSWSKYFQEFPSFLISVECVLLLYLTSQGSPVIAAGYVEQFLNSPDLCPPVGKIPSIPLVFKEKIRLANFPNNTVVVKFSRWQERNPPSAHLNFRCTLEVTAPKNHGIMMTIRSLHLRRYGQQPACIDYLKFKVKWSSVSSLHICGDVESSDKSEFPKGLVGPRYIYDPHAELGMTIITDDASPNDSQEPLIVELVFTATKACTSSSLNSGKVKQCTTKTQNSCIPTDLFCDGYINCGMDHEFGGDEKGCTEKPQTVSYAMSIFIFATTALATLVTVLLICCCCRRCKTKTSRAVPTDEEQTAEPNGTPPQRFDLSVRRPSSPTAPPDVTETPTEWGSSTPKPEVEDEDLPPSYKDLFPNSGTINR